MEHSGIKAPPWRLRIDAAGILSMIRKSGYRFSEKIMLR
jgi:hypothetical protein